MAHFRGTIQGTQGEASRLGTKETGLKLRAQTWGYDLVVTVNHVDPRGDGTGFDLAELALVKHDTGASKPAGTFNLTTGERLYLHPAVKHGKCKVCGHYGDDCTGQ